MPFPPSDAISPDAFDRSFFSSERTRELYTVLKSGAGFQNPVSQLSGAVSSQINSIVIPGLDQYINFAVPTPPSFQYTDFQGIKTQLQGGFATSQTNFLTHTNLISGVTNTTQSNIPNLRGIISVGSSSVALDNTLNELTGNVCGKMFNALGSLFFGPELYNEMTAFYQEIIGSIENETATAAQIQGSIQSQINQMNMLVSNDKQHFEGLINDLLFHTLANSLPNFWRDPCGRYLLEKVVGTSDITSIL